MTIVPQDYEPTTADTVINPVFQIRRLLLVQGCGPFKSETAPQIIP